MSPFFGGIYPNFASGSVAAPHGNNIDHVQGAAGIFSGIVREGAVGEDLVAGEFHGASTNCPVAIKGAVLRRQ